MPRPPLVAGTSSAVAYSRIIIVGAGGFGREVLQWARAAWPDLAERIAGFLSADPCALESSVGYPRIIGAPESYSPQTGDGLLLAIGIPGVRRRVAELTPPRFLYQCL